MENKKTSKHERSASASTPLAPDQRTISVEEASRWLGISRSTGYVAVKEGQLQTIRIGQRIRVLRAPLERMLAGQ